VRVVLMGSLSPVSVMVAHMLAARPRDELVGVIEECVPPRSLGEFLRKLRRLASRRGWAHAFARMFSRPFHRWYDARRERWLAEHLLSGQPVAWPEVPVVRVPSVNSAECHDHLRSWQPDVVIISGTTVLALETIALAKIATLNMHHGILPEIRGVYSIFWGLVEGRHDWIGVTIHVVEPQVDTGAILGQARVRVYPADCEVSLFARATREGIRILSDVVDTYARGETPQTISRAGVARAYRSVPTFWDFWRVMRRRGHLMPLPEAAGLPDGAE